MPFLTSFPNFLLSCHFIDFCISLHLSLFSGFPYSYIYSNFRFSPLLLFFHFFCFYNYLITLILRNWSIYVILFPCIFVIVMLLLLLWTWEKPSTGDNPWRKQQYNQTVEPSKLKPIVQQRQSSLSIQNNQGEKKL